MTAVPADAPDAPRAYLPGLDSLRGLAALGVVATHVGFQSGFTHRGAAGSVVARLDVGVAIFFVLSGFLLSREFHDRGGRARSSLRGYAVKRFFRVYPVYAVAVVLALIVQPDNESATTQTWVRELTLTQLYTDDPLSGGLTQMWSLVTEVAFYAVLPLLMWLLMLLWRRGGSRLMMAGLLVLSVAGLAWQGGLNTVLTTAPHSNLWLPGYLLWFCLGIGLAHLWLGTGPARALVVRLAAAPGPCWLIAGALLLIASTPVAGPVLLVAPTSGQQTVKLLLYGTIATLLVLTAAFGEPGTSASRLLSRAPLRWLGRISYSLFCCHLVVLQVVLEQLDIVPFTGRFWTLLAATVAASLLVSAALYRFLERPFIAVSRRLAPAPATAAARQPRQPATRS